MSELLRYDEEAAFVLADDAATIARIARTVPPDVLRQTRFDRWSALDVIGHVADMAEVFAERVRRAAEESVPHFVSIDGDALAAQRRAIRDPLECAKRLAAAHGAMVRLLARPGIAARPATHSEMGPVNAGHLAAYQAKHSHEHVAPLAGAFPPR